MQGEALAWLRPIESMFARPRMGRPSLAAAASPAGRLLRRDRPRSLRPCCRRPAGRRERAWLDVPPRAGAPRFVMPQRNLRDVFHAPPRLRGFRPWREGAAGAPESMPRRRRSEAHIRDRVARNSRDPASAGTVRPVAMRGRRRSRIPVAYLTGRSVLWVEGAPRASVAKHRVHRRLTAIWRRRRSRRRFDRARRPRRPLTAPEPAPPGDG